MLGVVNEWSKDFPVANNIIMDVKIQENLSINRLLADWGCRLKLDDNWALVTNIDLGKSMSQRVSHSNWYPINPSIAAVKELVSCEGDYRNFVGS